MVTPGPPARVELASLAWAGLLVPLYGLLPGLPPGTRAGLWNAGELGYFFSFPFSDVRVLTPDGLVNNELTRLARQGRYEQDLLENLDVLLEEPEPYLARMLGAGRARRFPHCHLRGSRAGGSWPVYGAVR